MGLWSRALHAQLSDLTTIGNQLALLDRPQSFRLMTS